MCRDKNLPISGDRTEFSHSEDIKDEEAGLHISHCSRKSSPSGSKKERGQGPKKEEALFSPFSF